MSDIVERLREGVFGTDETKTDAVIHSHMQAAADEIERLRVAVNDARNGAVAASECAGRMMEDRDEAFVEIARLRSGLMKSVQYDNKCDQTGRSCREDGPCGCQKEVETWLE